MDDPHESHQINYVLYKLSCYNPPIDVDIAMATTLVRLAVQNVNCLPSTHCGRCRVILYIMCVLLIVVYRTNSIDARSSAHSLAYSKQSRKTYTADGTDQYSRQASCGWETQRRQKVLSRTRSFDRRRLRDRMGTYLPYRPSVPSGVSILFLLELWCTAYRRGHPLPSHSPHVVVLRRRRGYCRFLRISLTRG